MKKRWGFVVVSGALIFLQACTTTQPKEDADLSRIEYRLTEINQRIDELNHRVSVLQFMVDDHQKAITTPGKPTGSTPLQSGYLSEKSLSRDATRNTAGSGTAAQQLAVPTDSAEAFYHKALAVYKSKDYKKAGAMFQSVAENYPGHELADNALYWTGECFYALKDYRGAIGAFKKVIKNYPDGSKVPDSLLKIGYAYLALKDPVNAQSFLKKVVKQYPFTPAGTKAGEMLKKIKT